MKLSGFSPYYEMSDNVTKTKMFKKMLTLFINFQTNTVIDDDLRQQETN